MSDDLCIKCREPLPAERKQHRAHLGCVTRIDATAIGPRRDMSAREMLGYVMRSHRARKAARQRGEI